MKKKHRCLFKRFAALVTAFMMAFALSVPVFAASDTEADMPSQADFGSHRGSWFVWRKVSLSGLPYYELTGDPILSSSSPYSLPTAGYYKTDAFNVSVANGEDTSAYGCSFPSPIHSYTGFWSDLPSFRVGRGTYTVFPSSILRCYSTSVSSDDGSVYVFLTSAFSSSSSVVSDYNSDSSGYTSRDLASFSSPLASYPFAYRSFSSSVRASYSLQGGDNSFIMPSLSSGRFFSLNTSRQLVGYSDFLPLSTAYTAFSSDLGVVFVKKPASSSIIVDAADFNTTFSCVFTLCVPVDLLPEVKVGDWLSDSPEDLQKTLTNEFNVDSGKLKDSKDSLNSWNSTSSVDTDLANTSLSAINALFQNLGQFLAIVSLLVFGAVVLRMFIRKAVDG